MTEIMKEKWNIYSLLDFLSKIIYVVGKKPSYFATKYEHRKYAENKLFQLRTRTESVIIQCKASKTNQRFVIKLCQLMLTMCSSIYDMSISSLIIY